MTATPEAIELGVHGVSGTPAEQLHLLPFTLTNVAPRLWPSGPDRNGVNPKILSFTSRLLAERDTPAQVGSDKKYADPVAADQRNPGPPDPVHRVVASLAYMSFDCVLRRNFWRHTDHLGGQVTAGPPPTSSADKRIDVQRTDPTSSRPPDDTSWAIPERHSNYLRDPAYAGTVNEPQATIPAAE